MTHNKFFFIIYGPTGVGKSDFALTLARTVWGEIINVDVGQFYTPLSIGTAKPDWQTSDVSHHLFDIFDKPINFTVADYRALVHKTMQEIWQRGNVPIVVGGSGFYISSLFFSPEAATSNNDTEVSNDTNAVEDEKTAQELWDELYAIDPERAKNIYPQDVYRIKRALAIWQKTGKKPSEFKPTYEPIAPYKLLFLTREREELYNRINERVKRMINEGWIAEVQELKGTAWENFLKRKKLIGYDDILHYLDADAIGSEEKLIETIAQKTRNYAKRQLTFWNMLEKKLAPLLKKGPQSILETVNLTNTDIGVYIKRFTKQIEQRRSDHDE